VHGYSVAFAGGVQVKSQPKLLLFDLDDTLLSSDKSVSQANINAITKCKALGMIIGYITARSPRKTKLFLKDLPCDCISYYNGATIFAESNLLEKNEIPYLEGIKTISEIKNMYPNVSIGVYLEPYSYFNGQIQNFYTKEVFPGTIQDLAQYDVQRIRVLIESYKDISLTQFVTSDMRCLLSSHGTAIITSKMANKKNSLIKFAKYFSVSIRDIIAFGDDTNDIDMIKTAGIGVAMGNAIDEVKAVADIICDTNDNDGVAKWINKFLL